MLSGEVMVILRAWCLLLFFSICSSSIAASESLGGKPNLTAPKPGVVLANGAKYQPYLEVGGAKYFKQNSSAAGIYEFFFPLAQNWTNILFADLRFFDRSGKSFEGNAHLGFRKLLPKTNQLVGIYGALDRKKTDFGNLFNQLTLGFEYWYSQLFVGGNFYHPIGGSRKLLAASQEIKQLGRAIVITDTRQAERSLPGFDAEVGYALTDSLTGYAGGYYFAAHDAETVAGPKFRVNYDYRPQHGRILGIVDGVSGEAGVQYDVVRKATAYVGIRFKLGLTDSGKTSNLSGFERHMVELVRRDPDIVVAKAEPEVLKIELAHKQGYMGSKGLGSKANETLEELLGEFGLAATAPWPEVRAKWREHALKYHPDKNPNGKSQFIHYLECYEKIEKIFQRANTYSALGQSQTQEKNDAFKQNSTTRFPDDTQEDSQVVIIHSDSNDTKGILPISNAMKLVRQNIIKNELSTWSKIIGLGLTQGRISEGIAAMGGNATSTASALTIGYTGSESIVPGGILKNEEVLENNGSDLLSLLDRPRKVQMVVKELGSEFTMAEALYVSHNPIAALAIITKSDISKEVSSQPSDRHPPTVPDSITINVNYLSSRRGRKDDGDCDEHDDSLRISIANFLSPLLCPISLGLNFVNTFLAWQVNPLFVGISAVVCLHPNEVGADIVKLY